MAQKIGSDMFPPARLVALCVVGRPPGSVPPVSGRPLRGVAGVGGRESRGGSGTEAWGSGGLGRVGAAPAPPPPQAGGIPCTGATQ